MSGKDVITEKIEQLITIAEFEGEVNVQIVLLALLGARGIKSDNMLANKVQEYLRDVLIPNAKLKKDTEITSKN